LEELSIMTTQHQRSDSNLADRFGNPIDPSVGYARGKILSSSLDEAKRREHAMEIIRIRAAEQGKSSFYNLTGLHRDYPVPSNKISWAEEWIGSAFYWDELVEMAKEHFGGGVEHDVAVFNRCSAGIIATCLALAKPQSTVLSVVPGKRSHPSIGRGVRLANAQLEQANSIPAVEACISTDDVSLVVITGVSSELEVVAEDFLLEVIRLAKAKNVPVFLDDAYGARLRPIIYHQPKTLKTGADIGVTACDKAGLGGPRAGLMVGRSDLIESIVTRGGELGLEARPPLALGVWASLAKFDPANLCREVDFGQTFYEHLSAHFGRERIIKSGLGASIPAEDVLDLVQSFSGVDENLSLVPAEITTGIGLYWLQSYGIISVNALGQPGASIWLRFKSDPAEVERFGGAAALIEAIDDGLQFVAKKTTSASDMRRLILGE
jgi:L-seryl-tRNA(Ser) seleniumtransferase